MPKLHVSLIATALILVATSTHGEGNATNPDLKSLMTKEQYEAAGLDKLTEAERGALSDWLRSYSGKPDSPKLQSDTSIAAPATTATAATPVPQAEKSAARATEENFGLPEPRTYSTEGAFELKANVIKPFRGWSGKTVFKLDNGQVWKQRASGKYTYMGDDTRVVISQNRWGFYDLRLVAADRSVGVTRVE